MNKKRAIPILAFLCLIVIGCQGISGGTGDDPLDDAAFDDLVTSLTARISADPGGGPDPEYTVTLEFNGPSRSPRYVYAAWIEDATVANDDIDDGNYPNNLQNLYVCDRILCLNGEDGLLGVALPCWQEKMYSGDTSTVDGVTGASTQVSKTITRDLDIGEETRFRVCFEIDRSLNGNAYFSDRPAFIYKSDVIDLNNLNASYDLDLVAYMPNDTLSGTWSQEPNVTIPGFEAYAYLTSLSYIKDED